MIGILCNRKTEKFIVERLHTSFWPLTKDNDMPIVVFTLQGLDLQEKMITGWLISCKRPSIIRTKLPAVIFNLAVQFSKSEIKKVRGLMETEDVSLFNITNRFNQWSIMEMLSSDNSIKKHVLPFADLNDKKYREGFPEYENYIVKPLKGLNLRKIIYWKHSDSVFRKYGVHTEDHRDGLDFKNAVFPDKKTKSVLIQKTPELLVNDSHLCITRIFAQRNFNDDWEVLFRTSIPKNECAHDGAGDMLNKTSIRIVSCINQFIPDVFFCLMDFVIDMNGIPYLLSFGGWDDIILSRTQNRYIHEKICKNMLEYAQAFISRPIEGGDYVD